MIVQWSAFTVWTAADFTSIINVFRGRPSWLSRCEIDKLLCWSLLSNEHNSKLNSLFHNFLTRQSHNTAWNLDAEFIIWCQLKSFTRSVKKQKVLRFGDEFIWKWWDDDDDDWLVPAVKCRCREILKIEKISQKYEQRVPSTNTTYLIVKNIHSPTYLPTYLRTKLSLHYTLSVPFQSELLDSNPRPSYSRGATITLLYSLVSQ